MDAKKLEYIDLSSNDFLKIPEMVFENNLSLKTLILKYNSIQSIEKLFISIFRELEKIDFQRNKIKTIPSINLPKLKYLDLSYNEIEFISNEAFRNASLTVLNLAYNKISIYPESFFRSLKFVNKLEISVHLSNVQKAVFENCKNLKDIDIKLMISSVKDPNLSIFSESFNKNCKSIETLSIWIETNFKSELKNITILDEIRLENLTKLLIVSKSESSFTVSNQFLENHRNITELTTEGKVYLNTLKYLTNMVKLELYGFYAEIPIRSDEFHLMQEINSISLLLNNFKELPYNIFQNMSKLNQLNLSFNRISKLPKDIFKYLTNLKQLNLGYNELESLHE